MRLQNEESYRHRRICLLKDWMGAVKKLTEPDHIVIALTHLPAIDGDHVVMQPETGRYLVIADGTLCDLAFVVRKLKVHPAPVNVELLTKVFCTHGRALDMPARKSHTPGTFPLHDMLRCGLFPKCEIRLVALFILRFQYSGRLKLILDHPTTQDTIWHSFGTKLTVVFLHIKIDRSIRHICITIGDDLFNHDDLFDDVARRRWFDAGFKVIEAAHGPMKEIGILLYQFHGLELLKDRLF